MQRKLSVEYARCSAYKEGAIESFVNSKLTLEVGRL